jgi:hypothetical protein
MHLLLHLVLRVGLEEGVEPLAFTRRLKGLQRVDFLWHGLGFVTHR